VIGSHPHSNTPFRRKDPNSNPSRQLVTDKGSSNTVTSPPSDVNNLPPTNPSFRPRAKSLSGSKNKRRGSASPLKVNGVVQLELNDATEQQLRAGDENNVSSENHSEISESEVLIEGSEEGEDDEEEDDEDEGDSDVEFDEEVLKKIYATPSAEWQTPTKRSGAANISHLFQGEEDEDEREEIEAKAPTEQEEEDFRNPEKNASMAGLGLCGEEGKALRALINPRLDLTQMSRDAEKELNTEKRLTFGPGAAQVHPWSSRGDGGINSRLTNERRGDEIYFIGIIDILQQYNASKQLETFFKVHSPSLTRLDLSHSPRRVSHTIVLKSVLWTLFLMLTALLRT
jgi:hypothetical protein